MLFKNIRLSSLTFSNQWSLQISLSSPYPHLPSGMIYLQTQKSWNTLLFRCRVYIVQIASLLWQYESASATETADDFSLQFLPGEPFSLFPFNSYEWEGWNSTRWRLCPIKSTIPTDDCGVLLAFKPHFKHWAWTVQWEEAGLSYPTPDIKMDAELCIWSLSSIQWGRCKTIRIGQFHHLQLLISKKTLM